MDNTPAQPIAVRRAAAADAAALTRLREIMLSDMGMLAAGADPAGETRPRRGSLSGSMTKRTSPPSSSRT